MTFIYLISQSDTGPVKIGYSKHPNKRLKQLQTGQSSPLFLKHVEEIDDRKARIMEQIIHRENRHTKLTGEWFNLTVEQGISEIRHAIIRFENEAEDRSRYGLTT